MTRRDFLRSSALAVIPSKIQTLSTPIASANGLKAVAQAVKT